MIVVTVLLNVIFGIIIDTFGELRGERAAKKSNMENTCFICSVDRFTFETKGGGFERHGNTNTMISAPQFEKVK